MTKRRCFPIPMFVLSCALAATQSGRCASSVDDPQSSRQAAGLDLPSGAIESMEQANAALDAVAKERTRADAEYKSRQSECYRKFLATPCQEREKKLYQKRIAELAAIELKASRFSRQERNRQVEERRRTAEQERTRSAEQRATSEQSPERTRPAAQQPPAPKQEKTARTAALELKPRRAPPIRPIDDAKTRRLSAEKYQKAQREAAERRERTAKARAEKVAKRAQKQAQKQARQQAQQSKKGASPIPAAAERGPALPSEMPER